MNTDSLAFEPVPLQHQDLLWCLRRLPRPVFQLLKDHAGQVFVAGGYVRSKVTGEHVNDVDLFVANKDQALLFAKELVAGDENRLIQTKNAITIRGTGTPIQIIHRWTYTEPAQVLHDFDFVMACAAFWYDGTTWQSACHPQYYADLAAKRLTYLAPNRREDAGGSILRVLKFYQRGYRIPLDSLGVVIARLIRGLRYGDMTEGDVSKVLTGLLREVDPNINPDDQAYLPSVKPDEAGKAGEIVSTEDSNTAEIDRLLSAMTDGSGAS